MKLKYLTTLCLAAFATNANAAIIQMNDYEAETAPGLNITPTGIANQGGGGDHVGPAAQGVSTTNPRSGTYSYVVKNTTAENGNGWGATWSGVSSVGDVPGSNVTSEANAIANGTRDAPLSYIEVSEGSTFTVSAWVALEDASYAGGGNASVRLEFFNDAGTELFRTSSAQIDTTALTTSYQQITHSYTVTAADITAGFTRVGALIGSDGHGFDATDTGGIVFDDFLFESDAPSFVTVVPEPASALLGLLGAFAFGLRRRR